MEEKTEFLLLKTICNDIIQNPSGDHPEKLNNVLNVVGERVVRKFADYILYPIKFHVYNENVKKRDDTLCILLDCLHQILQYLTISEKGMFIELYSLICFSLVKAGSQPGKEGNNTSEELKINSLKCAKLLFTQTPGTLLDSLYESGEFYSKLCVLIYNSLQFASKEKSIELRCLSLEFLLVACRLNSLSISGNSKVNVNSAKVVKKCLPGLITECRAIVSQGRTLNHKITLLALQVWSRSISLVVADSHNSEENKTFDNLCGMFSAKTALAVKSEEADNSKKTLAGEELSDAWIKAAAKRLSAATDSFTVLKLHPNFKVRRELVSSAALILTYAPRNMNASLGRLLDTLIVLTEDDNESVARSSQRCLETFKENWSENRGRLLVEDVKDCFCSLLNRLPRILHGTDDSLKESDMTLMCGYILLLGRENFSDFITSQQLLDKLINCLLEAASIDTSKISLLEELSWRDLDDKLYGQVPWRNFSVCHTDKLQKQLRRSFDILGGMLNLSDVAFLMMDLLNNSPLKRLEVTLCINDIVLSCRQIGEAKYSQIVKSIVNEYLQTYFWDVKIVKETSETKRIVAQTCMFVEGIGKLAKTTGPDYFSQYLFKCLYPLLEFAGSPYSCLAYAGIEAVRAIASVYEGDVGSLIEKNVDYLSHHISVKLRQVHRQVTVLYVLSAVMKHSNMSTLPSLLEIINCVLFQSFDRFQDHNLSSYLHVFKSFVESLNSWTESAPVTSDDESDIGLIDMLLNYQRMKEISDNCLNDDYDLNEGDSNTEVAEKVLEEEEKTKVPDHIKITEAIMLRSSHFLPSKDPVQQNYAMQILDKGCLILVSYPDVLLPVVHKIWSPLVERFQPSNDALVIRNAFSLLATLAFTAKEFIRQRSLKQVLPQICSILDRLSGESKLKPQLHGYRYSQKYKLQLELLGGLGELAINMDLAGKEIHNILSACQVYLSSTQPKPLQEACIDLYLKLSKLNRDMIWLHLISIWPQDKYLVTGNTQYKVEIKKNPDNSHMSKNIEVLLETLSSQ